MTPELAVILGITTYKFACLAVGTLFCVLGYRLFKLGIWGSAGDLDAKFNNTRLVLKSAAPGTFFAVLGAVIVVVTVWQGINFNWQRGDGGNTLSSEKAPPLPESGGSSK
jgi:hypothetical protein